MRVYRPATVRDLARLRDAGLLAGAFPAYAVTPALREWYAESGTDELEHAAFGAAERRSLRRLAADPSAPRLRVVISADVADSAVRAVRGGFEAGVDDSEAEHGAVLVDGDLLLSAVASVHVDEAEATPDVTAAVEALEAAARGDDDAQFLVDSAEGHDLLWYDMTELDDLLLAVGPS